MDEKVEESLKNLIDTNIMQECINRDGTRDCEMRDRHDSHWTKAVVEIM